MTKEQMEQIVLANMQKIYLYCVRRLGNTADAEDVSSDIIYELLGSYEKIKNDKAVMGYIWAVEDNLCKNYWRRSMKYEIVEMPDKYVGTFQITAEEELICEENMSLMRRELALLSNTYREIMVRHYIHGESCEKISQNLNIILTKIDLSSSSSTRLLYCSREQARYMPHPPELLVDITSTKKFLSVMFQS